LKTLLLSTMDLEGGAARATYRLHDGLKRVGVDSRMLVQRKIGTDETVARDPGSFARLRALAAPHLDRLPLHLYAQQQRAHWGIGWLPTRATARAAMAVEADIVNLHWVSGGFLSIGALSGLGRPLVWTLHDMWAFTGGCHYSQGCAGYLQRCGRCPQLASTRERDLSRWVWSRKRKALDRLDLTIVTPSRWLADCARSSSLLRDRRVETIPNGLNLDRFKPIDRLLARDLLSLPQGRKLILFGALGSTSDPRKGFQQLLPALRRLASQGWSCEADVVIFGASEPKDPPRIGLTTHFAGQVNDDLSLALLYSAADVFVAPSLEDNLPNTVLEAIACGTPAAAFSLGGMPDMIEHQQTGYLAKPLDSEDLARGISWILEDEVRGGALRRNARAKAEREFELCANAQRYRELFAELLAR
jgi:glycosyltransferase involved in cell wall biosynthesis